MPIATESDLDRAITAAGAAFKTWSCVDDEERVETCRLIANAIEANSEELARLLTAEQGKPLNGFGSRFELEAAATWTRSTADLFLPVEIIQENADGRVELHRKPIGVVGSITPWNWPVMIACWHIIPAIRVGNTVVIKPSPLTPLSTIRLVELINQIIPAGVVSVVTGQDELGAALSGHPGVAKVTFTGSMATGRKVMARAAGTLKRLTLELGGNDAGIVLPDVDPAQIAEGLFWSAFINNGQTCAALKRLYVHDSIYDATCEALVDYARTVVVGDSLQQHSALGPIQNEMQYKKVCDLVDDARAHGARILVGGEPAGGAGYFYPITLVADAHDDMRLFKEEQFGPVLPILRYAELDDTIVRANNSPWGLGGSIWSGDQQNARRHASRLECGSVWINRHGAIQPNAPFGGVKQSGIGVEFGADGLNEFTTIQTILV